MPRWQWIHSGRVSHRHNRVFDALRSGSGGVVRGASQAFAIGLGQDDIVVIVQGDQLRSAISPEQAHRILAVDIGAGDERARF